MRDIATEFKELRLQGMVSAWGDLTEQDEGGVAASKWLIEHLLQAEHTDRAMRSVTHQMFAAKFPLHRDLAGFDFTSSKVDQPLVRQLATLAFTLTSPAGKMMMTMLAAVAEMERDLLVERTQAGLARAKSEGKTLGRPSKTSIEQRAEIIAKYASGESVSALARTYEVSRANILGVVKPA